MAKREVTVVRGPITAGFLKEHDLKAIRAICASLAQLVSLNADKERVLAAVRVAENAAIKAAEAGSAAAEQAEDATKAVEEASLLLKSEVEHALSEATATRDEVQTLAREVAADSEEATAAASAASLDRQAVSELKASVETTAQTVAEDALDASQSASEASQSVKDAQEAATNAGFSFRYCASIGANGSLPIVDLVPSTNTKVGDHIVNAQGDIFEIVSISEDTFTVGSVVTSIKGATGTAGSSAWGDIVDKPTAFPAETHGHAIADVSGLQDALDGKQPAGNYATETALSDVKETADSAVKTVNGVAPTNGNVEIPVPEVDTSTLVTKSGNRGALAGYETVAVSSSAVTINASYNDTTQVTGAVAVTVEPGAEGTSWTKTVSLVNASATITLGDSWVWSGGEAPTVSENAVLVLHWCNDIGVANLLEGYKYLKLYTGVLTVGSGPVVITRDGVEIYRLDADVDNPDTVALAKGDSFGSSKLSTSNGIELDSEGTVVALEEGFSAWAYLPNGNQ